MGKILHFPRHRKKHIAKAADQGFLSALQEIYGILALAILLAFGAGYYFVPSDVGRLLPVALAPTPDDSIRSYFGVCGQGRRINCVVDGDTLYVHGDKIRLSDINTPELFSPQCGREAQLAAQAQQRLTQLLNQGPIEIKSTFGRDEDVYGRKLRKITRDGKSLGDILVAEGLAHKWRGYKQSWCS